MCLTENPPEFPNDFCLQDRPFRKNVIIMEFIADDLPELVNRYQYIIEKTEI